MMAAALLSELRDLGILLHVADGRLDLDAPRGALTDALLARVREAKPALMALLATETGSRGDVDDSELFEERAAVREYDGGLSRRLAERLARRDVAERFNPPDLAPVTLAQVAALFDAELIAGDVTTLGEEEERGAIALYRSTGGRSSGSS